MAHPAAAASRMTVAVAAARTPDIHSDRVARHISDALVSRVGPRVIRYDLVKRVLAYYDHVHLPPAAMPAAQHLSRSQDHFLHMRYDEAAAEVERAIALLEAQADSLHDAGIYLFDALMTCAMIAHASNDAASLMHALERAVRLNPAYEVDKMRYPPSIVSRFRRVRKQLIEAGSGGLRITTRPAVAEIYINGIPRGVSPRTITQLPAGSYDITIETNKYATERKRVQVIQGTVQELSVDLRWRPRKRRRRMRIDDGRREIAQTLAIAELLKVDSAVLIACEHSDDGGGMIRARIAQAAYRAAQRPIVAHYTSDNRETVMADLVTAIADALGRDIASDPARWLDTRGTADPVLLGKAKRKIYRRPLFWGAVGTAVAGAIAGGVIAAIGGGSSGESSGSVRVSFQ